ncbi:NYN domain-containing protein [Legionella pneumophila serogroup 1]|uniref:NYN domain-containing protein n=1 Tax=Legionella pneumophila TaxID=446 RepID=UPI0007868841|nr:NYN domain-containing protein [Legionella pneumophila]MCZ4679464.1 NYN domain-containing protein [Legionella pneumophila]MCZ4751348.1 NYN domain-containing protein [Legionella pneumophila]HAT1821256.1 NYN domain-containing protein [Legionella pneumophila]HAT1989536.1 NYN domain-containing protein [Legionella pneumophila]HAT1992416.1 NYN domain-containing protein [Legionella pneumophila]
MNNKRTILYIDGFNLYYGCLRKSPYKWLNLKRLFENLLDSSHQIDKIKYYTAHISSRNDNDSSRARQRYYLNALEKYIPEIEIYYGHYLTHKINAKVVNPPPEFIQVYKTEEKGSDVNLALHVLNDAWLDLYDCAVIVSNDSDLAESLRLVKRQTDKLIGVVFPSSDHKRRPSRELVQYADFIKPIRKNALKNSQLPDQIPGTDIHKPEQW